MTRRPPSDPAAGPQPDLPGWATALLDLVAGATMLHLSRLVDDEGDDVTLVARLYRAGQPVRVATADRVEDLLLSLAGREPRRVCAGCKEPLPLSSFRRAKNSPGGREYRCKTCAAVAKKIRTAKRKAAAAELARKAKRVAAAAVRPGPARPAARPRPRSRAAS